MKKDEPAPIETPCDPPGRKRRLKAAELRAALIAAGGVDLEAARTLGCSPERVRRARKRNASVAAAAAEARRNVRDEAELQLIRAMQSGVVAAITNILKADGGPEPAPPASPKAILEVPDNGR